MAVRPSTSTVATTKNCTFNSPSCARHMASVLLLTKALDALLILLTSALTTDNAEAMELHDKLKELDEIIVNTVAENSKEWLGKEFNVAVLREALYKPIVRPGKEPYPSTLKLKVATKPDGSFVPEAYNMQKEQVSLDTIEKGQKAMAIVDVSSIWFIDNKFGVTIRLQQTLLEQSTKLPSFAFQGVDLPDAGEVDEDIEVDEEEEEVDEE